MIKISSRQGAVRRVWEFENGLVRWLEMVLKISSRQEAVRRVWECENGKLRWVEIVLKISSRQGAVRRVWGEEGKKVRVWFIVKASYYNCYSLADLKLSWQKQKWTNSDQFRPNMWRQEPVSTMQKTGLTNYSSWKRVLPIWMWSLWVNQQPFSCALGHFRDGD